MTMESLLKRAYQLFEGKGYDPVDQFLGYLKTGDVSYFPVEDGVREEFKNTNRQSVILEFVTFFCRNLDEEAYYKKIYDVYQDVINGLFLIYVASSEKGYNPEYQLFGFITSWDSSYITSYKGARDKAGRLNEEDVLLFLIEFYLNNAIVHKPKKAH